MISRSFINMARIKKNMNFQGLKKIENQDFYIDLAFRKANERSSLLRSTKIKGTRIDKSKKIELSKIDAIKDVLSGKLMGIGKAFPDLESLPEFYNELVKCTVDYSALKKSLGALKWAKSKIEEMHNIYKHKIKKCKELTKINDYRRQFYGRVSSIMKQIKNEMKYIDQARRIMKDYPAIKTEMKTVAIAGFPNVGKTTLLMKLTGSKADIQPYAFTTKGINVGYLMKGKEKHIQLLDTPGTLNRFDRMNNIEKVAFLALKMLAEKIIYVFDITEPFPLEEQEKLYKEIKKLKKPVIVYLSKRDIISKEDSENLSKEYDIKTADEIKEIIF